MAENRKQSYSLLTRCFRAEKTIASTGENDTTRLPKTDPLFAITETIQTIEQIIPAAAEIDSNKQRGDGEYPQQTISVEQVEAMLIKWTRIAHFLIDTYQTMQSSKNSVI